MDEAMTIQKKIVEVIDDDQKILSLFGLGRRES
jgi:hypothetical protein